MNNINNNSKISRYLDLTKLMDFIQFNRLYFRQVDKYDDVFEGCFPEKIYELAKTILITDSDGVSTNIGIIEQTKLIRQSTYVSCWTANTSESMALWNLYGGKNGLCVQTETDTIMEELRKFTHIESEASHRDNEISSLIQRLIKPSVSTIRYIDHSNLENPYDPEEISKFPIIYKNIGFSYENEIRFFYDMRQQQLDDLPNRIGDGFYVPVDSNHIIKKILVSPSADPVFFENVQKFLSRSGLDNRLGLSSLKNPPYNESDFF